MESPDGLIHRRAEVLAGRFFGRPEKVTVKEVLDD
jgi:hypothetical protein